MSKKNSAVVALGAVLVLTTCTTAQADQHRVAGTAKVAHYPVGNTANSIGEVRAALEQDGMRIQVHTNLDSLLSSSEEYATSFEFERDLFVCEQLHPVSADHDVDHPESKPLATCVRQTFEAHQVGPS